MPTIIKWVCSTNGLRRIPQNHILQHLMYQIVFHFPSSSVVTIGFDAATYTFTETDSTVSRSVSVSVQSGSLTRDVVVTVQTVDGTAAGETLMYTL